MPLSIPLFASSTDSLVRGAFRVNLPNAGRGSSGIADNRPLSFQEASGSIPGDKMAGNFDFWRKREKVARRKTGQHQRRRFSMAANAAFPTEDVAKPPGYSYRRRGHWAKQADIHRRPARPDLEIHCGADGGSPPPDPFASRAPRPMPARPSRTWSRSTTISSTCRTSRSSARCATTTSTWRPRPQARRSRSLNWRDRARCSRSRRSRCCQRRVRKRRGRKRPHGTPAAR